MFCNDNLDDYTKYVISIEHSYYYTYKFIDEIIYINKHHYSRIDDITNIKLNKLYLIEKYEQILEELYYPPHLITATRIYLEDIIKNSNLIDFKAIKENIKQNCINIFHNIINNIFCKDYTRKIILNFYHNIDDLCFTFKEQINNDLLKISDTYKKKYKNEEDLKYLIYNLYKNQYKILLLANDKLKNELPIKEYIYEHILCGRQLLSDKFLDKNIFNDL